ncbi:MAG: VCBS repeat-containing protein, partial [Proteobacteria bacterium]|nr:VCBS repeat-containing protein [Pseudomonadota bacterium]
MPAGTAGLTPGLALQYRSGAGLGLLGRGWRLTGLSQIARCSRSFVHSASGFPEAIADASSDQLCLDGAPLVAVSGVYGQSGTEYRTEAESFSRIVATGSSALGPDGFEVRTHDGRILRYGFRDDAREAADNGMRRQWMLAEISDRNGNIIEMSYARACRFDDWIVECTFKAPSEIRYGIHRDVGQGAGKTQMADRRIQFVYGDRQDERIALWYGDRRLEWRTLEAVQTYVNGAMEREYRLAYGYQNQTTVLETVNECAGGVCRTAATITYDRDNSGFDQLVRTADRVSYGFGNGVSSGHIGQTIVLDVDGNGLDDLLFPTPNDRISGCPPPFDECPPGQDGDWTYHLAIATGDRNDPFDIVDTGLGSTTIYGSPFWCISQATVFDYNGDGRDDLASTCGAYTSRAVLVSTGTGFAPAYNALPGESNTGAFWLVDLNGDDLIDVLTCVPNDRLHLYRGRGPGRGFERTPRVLPNYGQGGVPPPGQFATRPCAAPLMLDIDGDGRAELMKSEYVSARDGSMRDAVWRQRWKALDIDATTARWIDTGLEFDDKLTTAEEDEIYRWILLGGIDAAIALPYTHKWQTKTV